MTKYNLYDLLDSHHVNPNEEHFGIPFEGIYTGPTAKYLAMNVWELRTESMVAYISEDRSLLEIRYKDYRILPWGEVHKMGQRPEYNGLYDTDWYTLDDLLDMIDNF